MKEGGEERRKKRMGEIRRKDERRKE